MGDSRVYWILGIVGLVVLGPAMLPIIASWIGLAGLLFLAVIVAIAIGIARGD